MLGAALKRWNLLELVGIPLAAVFMYASWVYPLFALLLQDLGTGTTPSGFTFWLCVSVIGGGAICGRMAQQNSLGVVIVVVGGLTAVAVSLVIAMPAETLEATGSWFASLVDRIKYGNENEIVPAPLILPVCVTFLWWRGVRLDRADHNATAWWFLVGVVALVGMLLLASTVSVGPSPEYFVGWMLLFLASGSVTLSRLGVPGSLRRQASGRDPSLRADLYWAAAILSVIVAVLAAGMVVTRIVAPNTVLRVMGWFRPMWTLLSRLILFLVYCFSYLFFLLFEPLLARIESRLVEPAPRPTIDLSVTEELEQVARGTVQIPPLLGQILQVVAALVVVLTVAYVFFLAVRRRKASVSSQDEATELRELVWSWSLLRDQMTGVLGGLRDRRSAPTFLGLDDPDATRRTIRELYQRILTQALEFGFPRQAGQTPEEYLDTLVKLFPGEKQEALHTLTRAYTDARYGLAPPTAEQVRLATEAFGRINAA